MAYSIHQRNAQPSIGLDDLKSGYIVKRRSGEIRMVMRAGQFTKVLVGADGKWCYLSDYDTDLCRKHGKCCTDEQLRHAKEKDIVEVYGLMEGVRNYGDTLALSTANRSLIWKRREAVKMTVSEISRRLGFEIEIVAE